MSRLNTGTDVVVGQSPFARAVATGYYDGPIEGVVDRKDGAGSYVFKMVDWDVGQDLRVFLLAESPISVEGLVEGTAREKHGILDASSMSEAQVERIEALLALRPSLVLAAWGILGEVVACRSVAWESVGSVTDWFDWLGIGREGRSE